MMSSPNDQPMPPRFRVGLRALMTAVAAVAVFLGGVVAGIGWEATRKATSATAAKGLILSPPAPALTPGDVRWDAHGNGTAHGHYTDPRGVTHRGNVIMILKNGGIIID